MGFQWASQQVSRVVGRAMVAKEAGTGMMMLRRATTATAGMLMVAAALVVGTQQALVQAQSSVTGDWEITLTTQTGDTIWQARFEQDANQLGGEIDLGDNEVVDVTGTVEGSMLKFLITVADLDGDQPINFEGEWAGDTITGAEGKFSWYGTGAWVASRK